MFLFLLRHGKAEDRVTLGQSDFSRALIQRGIEQSRNAARILSESDFLPEIILCSPFLRTKQTADEFSRCAGMPGPVSQSWLEPGMAPETALTELVGFSDFERVMIVGHEPDFSHLIQHLLGAAGDSVEVKKGSLACIEIHPPSSRGNLKFLMPFKLAKHME